MATVFRNIIISEDTVSLQKSPCVDEPPQPTIIHFQDIEHARAEGYAHGFFEGVAQEQARILEKENTFSALLHSIPTAVRENRLSLSTEIADIVLLVAQQLFINQQQNKEAITHQVTQIINQLNDKHNIEIALHPHDIAQNDFHINSTQYKNLRIVPDESLQLGGCIVRSEHGVFDAGIERQIDNLKHVLLQMKQGGSRE